MAHKERERRKLAGRRQRPPPLHRLGDVADVQGVAGCQVGDRACDFQHPVQAAAGPTQALGGALQQRACSVVERAMADDAGGGELGGGLTESLAMTPASSVSGFYIAHPHAAYFNAGTIGQDH